MLRTEAIKQFLQQNARPELALLYNREMEVQVNVLTELDDPDRTVRRLEKTYQGHAFHAYTDGTDTWKPIRVPYNDGTYKDVPLRWELSDYVKCIGMTGWNWAKRHSCYVGYDVDSLFGYRVQHDDEIQLGPKDLAQAV